MLEFHELSGLAVSINPEWIVSIRPAITDDERPQTIIKTIDGREVWADMSYHEVRNLVKGVLYESTD